MSDIYDDYGDDVDMENVYNPDEQNIYNQEEENVFDTMFKEFTEAEKQNKDTDNLFQPDILYQMNNDELKDIDNLIDQGLETRFFLNDPNSFLNSRVGMTERIGQDVTLGTTMAYGNNKLSKRLQAINRMYMNSQEIFTQNFYKACDKYGIDRKTKEWIFNSLFKSPYFEYKNPFGILFASFCIKNNKINQSAFDEIYNKYASKENISILDLIRYSRFIISLYQI
jgi:hypothetical protein